MHSLLHKSIIVLFGWLMLVITSAAQSHTTISKLQFINEYVVDFIRHIDQVPVSGLSGIDYDHQSETYYIISDDGEAHYFSTKIFFTAKGIDSLHVLKVHYLTKNGKRILPTKQKDGEVDPESIRINQATHEVYWTSEGERSSKKNSFIDPAIYVAGKNDEQTGSIPLPENLKMSTEEHGPRQNGTLEGLTFSNDYQMLYTSLEEPLYEDGPRASVTPAKTWSRIYQFNVKHKTNQAQYAYPLEPIAKVAIPQGAFSVNGISEILFVNATQLLVIERSYSTGYLGCVIKVFLADLHEASDVKTISSLSANPPKKEIKKTLLLNMESLGIGIDNIEGVTFGPDFPNGHKSLIFVSDNNFNPLQKTQLLLFEVIP